MRGQGKDAVDGQFLLLSSSTNLAASFLCPSPLWEGPLSCLLRWPDLDPFTSQYFRPKMTTGTGWLTVSIKIRVIVRAKLRLHGGYV